MAGSVESAEKSTTQPAHCLSLCHLFSTSPSAKMVSPKHFLEFKFPINKCLYWFTLITNCYILCSVDFHRSFAPTESRWFKKYFVCLYRKRNNSGMFNDAVISMHGFTILDFMEDPLSTQQIMKHIIVHEREWIHKVCIPINLLKKLTATKLYPHEFKTISYIIKVLL